MSMSVTLVMVDVITTVVTLLVVINVHVMKDTNFQMMNIRVKVLKGIALI